MFTLYDEHLHLFLTNSEILEISNTGRVMEKVRDHDDNPIIKTEYPWEGPWLHLHSAFWDPCISVYRLWYMAVSENFLCYAESDDGIRWRKPELGLYEYHGSKQNNILAQWIGGPVVCDPDCADPNNRYKMLCPVSPNSECNMYQQWVYMSKDGYMWRRETLAAMAGDTNALAYDGRTGEWIASSRYYTGVSNLGTAATDRREDAYFLGHIRSIAATRSKDVFHWGDYEPIFEPNASETPRIQFYSLYPFNYGNQYIGFLEWYDRYNQRLDTRLVSSADGRNWERVLIETPFLDRGPEGTWKCAWVSSGKNPPIMKGDEMRFYYCGRTGAHGSKASTENPRTGAIGLAALKKDRFMGLAAGAATAHVVTKKMTVGGSNLYINGKPYGQMKNVYEGPDGQIKVEILDERGLRIEGFGMEDGIAMQTDEVNHPYRWKQHPSLAAIKGKRVHLRLQFANAKLYSVRFGD